MTIDNEPETETDAVPRRVWSGTGLQVLGRFWSAGCTLAMLYLAAVELDLAGFGRFTFYLAVFAWLDALANMGTGQVAVQRTAANPEALGPVLASARRVRLSFALAGTALVAAIAVGTGEPGAGWIVLAALYPVTHALELSATVYRNRIAWGVPVFARGLGSGLSLAFVALAVTLGEGSAAVLLCAVAGGNAIANLFLHLRARPHLPARVEPGARAAGLLREALPLGIAALAAQTYFWADNVFVRAIEGDEPLGPYNVGVRFMTWMIMVAQYVSLTCLAWFTRRHKEGRLGEAVTAIGPPTLALAGLGCGVVWPWTEELLELFRPGFGMAGPSLRWLLGAAVAIYAGSVLLTAVVATGRHRAVLAISLTGLVVNLLGNAWAVPARGIEGAGMTTFATELVVAAGALIGLRRAGVTLAPKSAWRWLGGPALFCLGAWLSSYLPLD